MNTRANDPDGLAWLRAIRQDLQRDLGAKPAQRAAHYKTKDKTLRRRLYQGRSAPQVAK